MNSGLTITSKTTPAPQGQYKKNSIVKLRQSVMLGGRRLFEVTSGVADALLYIPRIPAYICGDKLRFYRAVYRRPMSTYYFFNLSSVAMFELGSFSATSTFLHRAGDRLSNSRSPFFVGAILCPPFTILEKMRVFYSVTIGLAPSAVGWLISHFWNVCRIIQSPSINNIENENRPKIKNILNNILKNYQLLHSSFFSLSVQSHLRTIFNKDTFQVLEEGNIYKIIPQQKLIAAVLNTLKTDTTPLKFQTYLYMGPGLLTVEDGFRDQLKYYYAKHKENMIGAAPQEFLDLLQIPTSTYDDLIARYTNYNNQFRPILNKNYLAEKIWACLTCHWVEKNRSMFTDLAQDQLLKILQRELKIVLDSLYHDMQKTRDSTSKKICSEKPESDRAVSDSKHEEHTFYPDTMSDQAVSAYVKYHLPIDPELAGRTSRLQKLRNAVSKLVRPKPRPVPVLTDEDSIELQAVLSEQRKLTNRMPTVRHCMNKLIACDDWKSARIGRGILPLTLKTEDGQELPVYHISCGRTHTSKTATLVFANVNNNFVLLAVAEHTGHSGGAAAYRCLWQNPEWNIRNSISYNQSDTVTRRSLIQEGE